MVLIGAAQFFHPKRGVEEFRQVESTQNKREKQEDCGGKRSMVKVTRWK